VQENVPGEIGDSIAVFVFANKEKYKKHLRSGGSIYTMRSSLDAARP
jgi:hypothetical protein